MISRRPGARNGPKTPTSEFCRSWGPFWANRLLTKFDRVRNADPVNLFGVPCATGVRDMAVFFGGGVGAILSVGDRFSRLGTRPTKKCFGRNSAPPVGFRDSLPHQNHVRVAHLCYFDDVGWFHPSFSRNSPFTGFWRGLSTSGPQPTKTIWTRKRSKKC